LHYRYELNSSWCQFLIEHDTISPMENLTFLVQIIILFAEKREMKGYSSFWKKVFWHLLRHVRRLMKKKKNIPTAYNWWNSRLNYGSCKHNLNTLQLKEFCMIW
jgi:hypothetical protein